MRFALASQSACRVGNQGIYIECQFSPLLILRTNLDGQVSYFITQKTRARVSPVKFRYTFGFGILYVLPTAEVQWRKHSRNPKRQISRGTGHAVIMQRELSSPCTPCRSSCTRRGHGHEDATTVLGEYNPPGGMHIG